MRPHEPIVLSVLAIAIGLAGAAGCGRHPTTSPDAVAIGTAGGAAQTSDSIPPDPGPPGPPQPYPPGVTVACLSDSVLVAGSTGYAFYTITSGARRPRHVKYELTSERDWPGFPIRGRVTLPPESATQLSFSFAVPDSAAESVTHLCLGVTSGGGRVEPACCAMQVVRVDQPPSPPPPPPPPPGDSLFFRR